MNKKRLMIIGASLLIVIGISFAIKTSLQENNEVVPQTQKPQITEDEVTNNSEILTFLKEVSGVKAQDVEIVDNPVGIKGKFLAPSKSILNGVDYFLKDTNNDKIKNIEVKMGSGYIKIEMEYEVNKFITTPVEVKVKPYLDASKNLVLEVYDLKFLDLKVASWIVDLGINAIIKDMFSEESNLDVAFSEGKVIVNKSNFKEVTIESLELEETNLSIEMFINLEKIL